VSPELDVPEGLSALRFEAMGTRVLVLAPAEHAVEALDIVRPLFEKWESTLSRFRADSELAWLNARGGRASLVSPLLLSVLVAALATGGLFDPTLRHELVRIGYATSFESIGALPAAETPSLGGGGGGWRDVAVDRTRSVVTLPASCRLDLGGIAKGMAVDAALARLASAGIEPALVSAGGDLAVRGHPAGTLTWAIAVGESADVVSLRRGALATSGSVRRRWVQGVTARHHLVDPRTGEPAWNGLVQVTVAAGSCRAAEVAATAAFVAGPRGGVRLLERNRLAGLFFTDDGRRLHAGPWPSGVAAGDG
jgi:thiamine biosynthesis lipoprotein